MSSTDHTDNAARVIIAEADAGARAWLERCLDGRFDVRICTSARELWSLIDGQETGPAALIVGRALGDAGTGELLVELAERAPVLARARIALFVANLGDLSPADLPEGSSVHYALDSRLAPEHVHALILQALASLQRANESDIDAQAAVQLTRVLDITRSLARHTSLESFAEAVEHAIVELCEADRGHCLFHDADSGILWSESEGARQHQELAAFLGLAGFAARVGTAVHAPRAADDPRYRAMVDDPEGTGDESIVAVPVVGPDGMVHAVLCAVGATRPLLEHQRAQLDALARHISSTVHQLALRAEAQSLMQDSDQEQTREQIFRPEALEAYVSRGRRGDVVRVLPPWIHWSYWVLLLLLAVGVVYLVVGRVDEYSVGHAVVRMTGRSDITAHSAGKVVSVEVASGQRVARGQILARLYSAEEVAELERVDRDFQARLRARMLDPADALARQSVSSSRTEVERARARLEERTIRAPSAGTVADIRLQPGQQLSPGDVVASLVGDDTELSVIALMPGADRPKLAPGMALRVELSGYRYAYQDLTIDKVSDEIIGPGEARRYLGKRIGDGVVLGGPVVVVEAKIPAGVFEAQGTLYRYHDGLQGVAEVRTRSRRIIVALIPQLEELE